MKYNNQKLIEYCTINNILLMNEYKDSKINRESYIEGKCVTDNCKNIFNKTFRQLTITGGYCQPCIHILSSHKIRDSKVKYDIQKLNLFCNENNILLTDDYSNKFINRDTIIQGICLNSDCNNVFNKSFRQLLKINGYCENCSKENGKIKIKETNIKRYGVNNPMKKEELKEKQINTMIEKYGVTHNSQLEEIKEQKKKKSLEKYGVEYILQASEIRQQIKETNLEKYGVENPQQNIVIRNKKYKTNLNKYGVENYFQTKEFQEKSIKTNLEIYGVPHHSQNSEIADLMLQKSYNIKHYTLPSGKIIDYQGYENYALDELLLVEKIKEYDIITSRKNVPEIWYNDRNNKRRRHYVDIYIKSQNRCIEVKSTWTNQEKNNVFQKQISAKDLGLKYEIWVYDKNGTKIQKW